MIAKLSSAVIIATIIFVAGVSASTTCGINNEDRRAGVAFKFASSFQIINSTLFTAAVPQGYYQYPLENLVGNIIYSPQIKSVSTFYVNGKRYTSPDYALNGNMSVTYGPSNVTFFTAYTGGYDITPDVDSNGVVSCDNGLVCHYIYLSSSSGLAKVGMVACRRYLWIDNQDGPDAILRLYINGAADLYWHRNWNYGGVPTGQACAAVATLIARPGSWVQDGKTHTIYDVKVSNAGTSTVTGATVEFTLPSGVSISSSWNLALVSGSTYTVSLNGLAAGQSSSTAGVIVAGNGVPVVSVSSTCN